MKTIILFLLALIIFFSENYRAQQIHLIYPEDGGFVENNLHNLPTYPITWSGPPKNLVSFYYSFDEDMNWLSAIVSNSTSSDTSVIWSLPDTTFVECKVKVVETADTTNFDQNQIPFTIYSSDFNFIGINEILMWISNNGAGSQNPLTGDTGLYWPGGINATIPATFADGLWWGTIVNNEKRAGGSYFIRSGTRPGIILPNGSPSDPTDSLYKIWKIRRDWQSLPPGPERDQYEFDYKNWPAEIGAPWIDLNGDGIFTRGVDLPDFIGDETLWYVSNDLDTAKSLSVFGSLPIGLEFQVTTWGYDSELLKDAVFKKYKVINKGNNTADDMILGFWSDDDLGWLGDDYPGCDSLLNMGYIFNGDNDDQGFYGTPPPAIGRMIIQAPIIPAAATDSARFGEGWRKGFLNLRMSAYSPGFKNWIPLPIDPPMGIYDGTIEVHNLLHGLHNFGDSLINPHTGYGTIFPLTGDPESATGWYCGTGWPGGPPSGDRRSLIPSGPFSLAPGDTNEIVIAVFLQKGTDNLNSVTKLKDYASYLQQWYNTTPITDVKDQKNIIPLEFSLSQNYPNPFNPVTTIEYEIPEKSLVTIKVYDILGREVEVLVNEEQDAGYYKIDFNAGRLASGIYLYRLQVYAPGRAGSFVKTKKMVLLR